LAGDGPRESPGRGTTVEVSVRRVAAGARQDATDAIAVEEPLEIRIGFPDAPVAGPSRSLLVTMRTPGDDEVLARGFLFAEGLVQEADDVLGFVTGDPAEGRGNILQVNLPWALQERFAGAGRAFYTTSACGVCGKASLDALRARARYAVADDELRVPASVVFGLPAALAARQPAFAATGGLHAAALFTAGGVILDTREDVGRHNALDKLIGAALRDGRLPLAGLGILVSGRASFELVEKARMAGCPLLVAVGAPSSLAVEAAWDCGMTLAGFLRGGRFNIYAAPARITDTLLQDG